MTYDRFEIRLETVGTICRLICTMCRCGATPAGTCRGYLMKAVSRSANGEGLPEQAAEPLVGVSCLRGLTDLRARWLRPTYASDTQNRNWHHSLKHGDLAS